MPHFTTTRCVHHSATDMFDLVADVEAYPKFVPLCESLKVRSRRQEGDRETLIATMTVSYRLLRESFTTKVVLDRGALTIDVAYLDGPFSHLENVWRFSSASLSSSSASTWSGAASARSSRIPHIR